VSQLIQIDTHTARAGVVSVDSPKNLLVGRSIRMLWAQFNSPWNSDVPSSKKGGATIGNDAAMCASQSKPIAHT